MMPIAPVRATCVPPHADTSKSSTSISRKHAFALRFLAQRQRRDLIRVGESNRDRPVLPDDAIGLGLGARDLAGVTSRARSIVDDGRAEVEADRPHAAAAGRTPPTARAARCAAACARSVAASRSRPCTGPAAIGSLDHVQDPAVVAVDRRRRREPRRACRYRTAGRRRSDRRRCDRARRRNGPDAPALASTPTTVASNSRA